MLILIRCFDCDNCGIILIQIVITMMHKNKYSLERTNQGYEPSFYHELSGRNATKLMMMTLSDKEVSKQPQNIKLK